MAFYLMICLNFTTRGGIAVYETQISTILLNQHHLTELQLGATISFAGIIGTIQLLFYRYFWTATLTDYTLTMFGLIVMGLAQVLVIVWGPESTVKPLWTIIVAVYLMYALGYPVGNTAVLGCFSKIQKVGLPQGVSQSQFALMGSLSRIVIPILSGYFEKYVEPNSSFGITGLLMCISIIGMTALERYIRKFTEPKPAKLTITLTVAVPGQTVDNNQPEQQKQQLQSATRVRRPIRRALPPKPLSNYQRGIIVINIISILAILGAMADWFNSSW